MSRDEEQTKKSANNNNLKIAHQGQQNQMRNPFFGGDLIVRQGQQNPPMGNPFFGPFLMSQGQMMGPRMPMKGGGFGPGYDPWRLQIDSKAAEKLKDPPVGLFGSFA